MRLQLALNVADLDEADMARLEALVEHVEDIALAELPVIHVVVNLDVRMVDLRGEVER